MAPTVLLLVRSASGCLALAVIVRAMGRPLFSPGWRNLLIPFAIMAVTNALIPWVAIAWGEERISSGLASILNSTTTLWTAVLIYWVVPTERPSWLNYLGVALGFAGVIILVFPEISAHGLSGNFFASLAVVGAALSYAINALYQRRRMKSVSVFEVSLGQLIFSVLFAIPIAAPAIPSFHFALASMAAVIALGVGGTGIAYLLYYYVMNTLGAVRAAGVTLLVPVTAVFWGVILLQETLSVAVVAGMLVILAGIVLTNIRRAARPEPLTERDTAAA
jgi:drug/metabolite transporter (DMT)-like permease